MTYTLILTRHAKSSWNTPGLADHDRPLNQRGVKSAQAIGEWLHRGGWAPDQTLSSSSRRTRETFKGLKLPGRVAFTDALYHANADQMRQVLASGHGRTILMLGHNPGIGEFAGRLLSTPPDHLRFDDYPTCATLIVTFDIGDWSRVEWGTGRVIDFVIPREVLI
ncbi:MAG: histidine phosphatase family protein [Rhodobacteraceae bacterium]|nr:histidine phosphatase family protein [Paracoccaceae bacterium]